MYAAWHRRNARFAAPVRYILGPIHTYRSMFMSHAPTSSTPGPVGPSASSTCRSAAAPGWRGGRSAKEKRRSELIETLVSAWERRGCGVSDASCVRARFGGWYDRDAVALVALHRRGGRRRGAGVGIAYRAGRHFEGTPPAHDGVAARDDHHLDGPVEAAAALAPQRRPVGAVGEHRVRAAARGCAAAVSRAGGEGGGAASGRRGGGEERVEILAQQRVGGHLRRGARGVSGGGAAVVGVGAAKAPRDEEHKHGASGEDEGDPRGGVRLLRALWRPKAG